MPRTRQSRLVTLALTLGGLLWIVLRPLVSTTWSNSRFGLTYEDYNRLMVFPLVLLLAGALGMRAHYPPGVGRSVRAWWGIIVLGLALSLAGVVIEFWWGGGLRGSRDLAMAGWGFYLLGLLGQAIGRAMFGVGALRTGAQAGWLGIVPLAMAALHVLWVPSGSVHSGLSVADQVLLGLGWMALGFALWSGQEMATAVRSSSANR